MTLFKLLSDCYVSFHKDPEFIINLVDVYTDDTRRDMSQDFIDFLTTIEMIG